MNLRYFQLCEISLLAQCTRATISNAKVLRYNQLTVDATHIEEVQGLEHYDAVVLGSAIYFGEWLEQVTTFLLTHTKTLQQQHLWLFASGPTGEGDPLALVDGVIIPDSLVEVVAAIKPRDITVFGGKIDLRRLRKSECLIVQAAQVQKGDFRNWHAIKFWAQQIADALKTVSIDKPCEEARLLVKD